MCLIVFGHRSVPGYQLVLAANRDEFLARPTAKLGWWEDDPNILAGRDLNGGGTWLGVNKRGQWAALTNYRDMATTKAVAPSRGDLPIIFLKENLTVLSGLERVAPAMDAYNGFNLLMGNIGEIGYLSNMADSPQPQILSEGFYGLSNHLLNTPWTKVTNTLATFTEIVKDGSIDEAALFAMLGDQRLAPDDELPETGIGYEMEKLLSAAYITVDSRQYGTRVRTLLSIRDDGLVNMVEWERGEPEPGVRFSFMAS